MALMAGFVSCNFEGETKCTALRAESDSFMFSLNW